MCGPQYQGKSMLNNLFDASAAANGIKPGGSSGTTTYAPSTPVDPGVIGRNASLRHQASFGSGLNSSILTGTAGLTDNPNKAKSLLGQ